MEPRVYCAGLAGVPGGGGRLGLPPPPPPGRGGRPPRAGPPLDASAPLSPPPPPATTLRAIRYPVWSKAPPTSGPPGLRAGPTSSSRPSRHPVGPTCAASDRSSARSVHLGRHFGRILYFVRRRSS